MTKSIWHDLKSTDRPLGCWQIFFSHLILDKPTPVHMHCCVYQMSNWIPKQWQFVIDVSVLYKFFVYCNKHISRWCAKQWQAILNVSDIARPSPQGYCKDECVSWPIYWNWSGILKTVDIPSPEPFIFLLINVKIFYMVIVAYF